MSTTSSQAASHDHGAHLTSSTVETVSGLTAGLVSTIIVHPLDIIKTRLQISTNNPTTLYGASLAVFRTIFHNEGPTRLAALYRGLTPNLVGNSAGWALYFLWYKQGQDLIREHRNYSPNQQLSSAEYLSASAVSGALSAILTNPIWVVKTRMLSTSATTEGAYPSMWTGLRSIHQTEGLRGYFHGLTPTLVGVSHGALYFVAYEKIKLWQRNSKARHGQSEEPSNLDTIIASTLSKVWAGTLTYPHQVIRARMQTYDPSSTSATAKEIQRLGVTGVLRKLWRKEGILGLYKGLGPNLLRVLPNTCVTFLVYENMRWGLPRLFGENDDKVKDKGVA